MELMISSAALKRGPRSRIPLSGEADRRDAHTEAPFPRGGADPVDHKIAAQSGGSDAFPHIFSSLGVMLSV
ncbi:MAG TPA: hypothetical protein VF933_29125 [Streptosporangiaceae bacterium]